MIPLNRCPARLAITHKLRARQRVRRGPFLDPIEQRKQDILLRRSRDVRTGLTDLPGAVAVVAVAHAGDAEVPVEVVEGLGREVHGRGDVLVVAGGVGGGDDCVGEAVGGDELAAAGFEGGEVAGPA